MLYFNKVVYFLILEYNITFLATQHYNGGWDLEILTHRMSRLRIGKDIYNGINVMFLYIDVLLESILCTFLAVVRCSTNKI